METSLRNSGLIQNLSALLSGVSLLLMTILAPIAYCLLPISIKFSSFFWITSLGPIMDIFEIKNGQVFYGISSIDIRVGICL